MNQLGVIYTDTYTDLLTFPLMLNGQLHIFKKTQQNDKT